MWSRSWRRIIQDERAVRKNPKHPDYSGLEFVLKHTTDVSGAASTAVFNRWNAQTQREDAAGQHREELANEAKRQNGGGRGKGSDPLPAKQ